MARSYRILIGANGWLHPAWSASFYPADLPDDWQLGYYSNEFPVALIPAAYWQYSDEEIQSWLEDSADSLRLLCEVPVEYLQADIPASIERIEEFVERISFLGEHCLGLLFNLSGQTIALDEMLKQLSFDLPVCIDPGVGLSEDRLKLIQKVCEQNKTGMCWHGKDSAAGLHYGQLAVTRINALNMDVRHLRTIIETILQQTTTTQNSILIVDGDPPDLTAIRHMSVILDLF